MPAEQEAVDRRRLLHDRLHATGQRRDVLIVFENRHPLRVFMRAHALEAFEHFESREAQTALGAVELREHSAPDGVGVQYCTGALDWTTVRCSAVSAEGCSPRLL